MIPNTDHSFKKRTVRIKIDENIQDHSVQNEPEQERIYHHTQVSQKYFHIIICVLW